jgi:anaerobic selenocysteine-containing dehydrogenase
MTLNANSSPHTAQAMCPYCGVGCLLDVTAHDNKITALRGTPNSPVNKGLLCPKGALLAPVLDAPGRLYSPLLRAARGDGFRQASWDEAMSQSASRLQAIIHQHGPHAVAMYGSGQLDTEAWYVANKLFKGHLGCNNVDSNSRLCMASAVVAYNTTLGSDGPPTCYDDINHSDCVMIAGSNMAEAHPVTFQLLKQHRANHHEHVLIVVDPRETITAKEGIHVPIKPGTDTAFFHALSKVILNRGGADADFIAQHTQGLDDYIALLSNLSTRELAQICGISMDLLLSVASLIMSSRNFLSFYCMGLGQSSNGVAKHQALINLHLLTGQIGKPGAGPFSLTGQPNAMGGRELGGLCHLLPGYRLIENAQHRHEVEQHWGVPEGRICNKKGLSAVEIFQAMDAGEIKAMWIAATNPAVSLPNLPMVKRALQKCKLVIVQDCYENETMAFADVVLPVAQWVERSCTMTNSERRVTRSAQVIEAPSNVKPDWQVFCAMARQLGFADGFAYERSEQIWDEFRLLTKGRPNDMSGMTNARLAQGPLQWPCPHETHPGTARRYLDKQFATPSGKANFVAANYEPPQERTDNAYPLTLTTGRIAAQWHTMTRTGKVPKLHNQAKTPYVNVHPEDAVRYGVHEGEPVQVRSKRGCVQVEAKLTDKIRRGVVFMPFHWGDLFAPGQAANTLTIDAFDPVSKEPEYKVCAVSLNT